MTGCSLPTWIELEKKITRNPTSTVGVDTHSLMTHEAK